jgi:hypothetical protein
MFSPCICIYNTAFLHNKKQSLKIPPPKKQPKHPTTRKPFISQIFHSLISSFYFKSKKELPNCTATTRKCVPRNTPTNQPTEEPQSNKTPKTATLNIILAIHHFISECMCCTDYRHYRLLLTPTHCYPSQARTVHDICIYLN